MIQDFGEKAKTHDAHMVAEYIAERSGLMDELKQDTTVEGIAPLGQRNQPAWTVSKPLWKMIRWR